VRDHLWVAASSFAAPRRIFAAIRPVSEVMIGWKLRLTSESDFLSLQFRGEELHEPIRFTLRLKLLLADVDQLVSAF
jgi:hypothetical protein